MKMLTRSLRSLLLVSLLLSVALAQNPNPGPDEVFRPGEIAMVYVTMDSADKAFLLHDDNIWYDDYLYADLRFVNSQLDTLLTGAGIRLRGNTSRGNPKRSFKLKFKEYGGSKLFGHKKFNLKATNNDPSMLREHFSMYMFRETEVPAARSHHTEVYINGEYMGLYINLEQVDDVFLNSRFAADTGNLYKCVWGATLEDNNVIYDNAIYELKTNKTQNDRSKLAHFVDVLNNTPNAQFKTEIEKVLNVQPFIRYLAVEALIGHWDGYSYLKNNYYLYENPVTGKMEFIAYDTDNTWGIDWIGRDWGTRDVLDWPNRGEPRPLTKRILAEPDYLDDYVAEMWSLLNDKFTDTALFPQFDTYKVLLDSSIFNDSYYTLSWGYSYQDYLDSHDKEVINHAPYGLKPYVLARMANASNQLPALGTGIEDDLLTAFSLYPNPAEDASVRISFSEVPLRGADFRVVDLQGQQVSFSFEWESAAVGSLTFDENQPAGLYFLQYQGVGRKLLLR